MANQIVFPTHKLIYPMGYLLLYLLRNFIPKAILLGWFLSFYYLL